MNPLLIGLPPEEALSDLIKDHYVKNVKNHFLNSVLIIWPLWEYKSLS